MKAFYRPSVTQYFVDLKKKKKKNSSGIFFTDNFVVTYWALFGLLPAVHGNVFKYK